MRIGRTRHGRESTATTCRVGRRTPQQPGPRHLRSGSASPERTTMRSHRMFAPLALGAALVAVAVVPTLGASSAVADPTSPPRGPVATATGGAVDPAPLPSLVNVRVVRSEAALERAATLVDQGQSGGAVAELNAAVLNMKKAWSAARWIIKNTPAPPPVATDGRVHAHSSGGAVTSATATPEDTAFAVLGLQHEVVTTAVGLITGPDPALAPTISTTITAAMTARNAAVNYIHSIAPPPVAADGRVHAHASGAVVASGWSTVMPGVVPQLDDEIQMATGARSMVPTSPIDLA